MNSKHRCQNLYENYLVGDVPESHLVRGATNRELLAWGSDELRKADILNDRGECEQILSDILGIEKIALYLDQKIPDEYRRLRYQEIIALRKKHFPLQYILGKTFFYGLEFIVTSGVFIPRPETELLVELAINLTKENNQDEYYIWDMCCGVANIAITFVKNIPNCKILATDISAQALAAAGKNINLHNCINNIELAKGDLFAIDLSEYEKFDIIAVNPPYLNKKEMLLMTPELKHEPKIALSGGEDGLYYYNQIVPKASHFLRKGGFLVLEIGEHQVNDISYLFKKNKSFAQVKAMNDLTQRPRITYAQKL
ncbi:MAG: peptide chain release factor N(5)-glutamine methyltransferase [Candidatus Omnitrophota bacterium]